MTKLICGDCKEIYLQQFWGTVNNFFLFLICICVISLTDNCFWWGMQKEMNGSWINKWRDFRVAYWFLSPIYSALNLIIAITLHLFEKNCMQTFAVCLVQLYFSCFKISYDFWDGKTITEIPALGKYPCKSPLKHYVEALDQLHEHLFKN